MFRWLRISDFTKNARATLQDLPVGYLLPVFASQDNHDIDDPISPWAVVFMVSTNVFILLW